MNASPLEGGEGASSTSAAASDGRSKRMPPGLQNGHLKTVLQLHVHTCRNQKTLGRAHVCLEENQESGGRQESLKVLGKWIKGLISWLLTSVNCVFF